MKTWVQRSALPIALLCLSGCDWVGLLAKEAAVAATSHRGWDTFTFKGQLPAEFGIDAIAFYGANEPGKASCQTYSMEPGKTITRWYAKRYTAEMQGHPQEFSFEIPLSYYKGLCGMSLGRVKLEINARYGKDKWQNTYGKGNLVIEPEINTTPSTFNTNEELHITAFCSLMFQEGRLHFGIEKLMSCKGAGAVLPNTQLANKTVNFHVEVNPTEKPTMRNRWIQTEQGWKPCQPMEKSNRCQTPPIFKTFKMNGQTCTLYPSCTE